MSGFYKKLYINRQMNQKQIDKWEYLRNKGKKSYVIIYGILLWGIPVSILGEVFSRITRYGFTLEVFSSDHFVWKIIIRTTIFIVEGIFFGLYMWRTMEKKYQKSIEKNTN